MKDNKGITLISLVITIIILMILAGISIKLVFGENGIIAKAQYASTKTKEASLQEKIESIIWSSMIDGEGNIDLSVLEKELKEGIKNVSIEKQGDNGNLPWIVKVDKLQMQIDEDGAVKSISGIILSRKNVMIMEGSTNTITATLTEGVRGTITWSSEDTNIATVNGGKITAVKTGTTTITASVISGGVTYKETCEVTVLSESAMRGKIESAIQKATQEDNTIDLEVLESELKKIEEVTGIEKQGTEGNLPWTVLVGDYEYKISEDGSVEFIKRIKLSNTELVMFIGETATLNATLTGGLDGEIEWEYENADFFSFDGHNIKAISARNSDY